MKHGATDKIYVNIFLTRIKTERYNLHETEKERKEARLQNPNDHEHFFK